MSDVDSLVFTNEISCRSCKAEAGKTAVSQPVHEIRNFGRFSDCRSGKGERMKKLSAGLISLLVILSGCGQEPTSAKTPEPKEEETVFFDAETVSADVTNSGKKYSNSMTIEPGHWERTEVQYLGPVVLNGEMDGKSANTEEEMVISLADENGSPAEYHIHPGMILDRYDAGEESEPTVVITRHGKRSDEPLHLYGSLYFADVEEGDDPFGQKISVREYFRKRTGAADRPVVFHHFGTGYEEGRTGGSEGEDRQEFFYDAAADFPRLIKDGDTISVVFEVTEETSGISMRNVYTYSWIKDEAGEPAETEEDHSDSGWMYEVYPGHWDLTDVRYVSEVRKEQGESEALIKAERKGADGQNKRYVFAKDGEELVITIPEQKFADRYYAGDSFFQEVKIYADSRSEMEAVNCSIALGQASFDEESGLFAMTPESYLTTGWPRTEVPSFGPIPHNETMSWRNDILRGYLMMYGEFPEGGEDGEKIWLVYGMMDEATHAYRMYDVYEYTWTKGPDTVWTYNQPMY